MKLVATNKGRLYKPSFAELTEFDADGLGLCVVCGETQSAEPDARRYRCDCCDADSVYGAAELALMGFAHD